MRKRDLVRNFVFAMLAAVFFTACATTSPDSTEPAPKPPPVVQPPKPVPPPIPPPPVETSGITLHLIIIADTLDNIIGRSVAVDSRNLQNFFTEIVSRSDRKLSLNKIVLEGRDITRHNLFTSLKYVSQRIKRDDVVVFAYSGHGYRNQEKPSIWPMLNTRENVTDFDEVIAMLKTGNPRQFIALADCCNSFVERAPAGIRTFRMPEISYRDIERMFVIPTTKIAASGSKPGQYSGGDEVEGGYFTSAFLTNLRQALISPDGNWDKVFTESVSIVSQRTQDRQQPQYEEIR